MHQTTVRFRPDLWEALEAECARLGISAAQFVREATLARLSYTAARRGDEDYERALTAAVATAVGDIAFAVAPPTTEQSVAHAREDSTEQRLAATAVSAQSEQVRRRAREVRERSAELRRRRKERLG